jgi:hypothetical protein
MCAAGVGLRPGRRAPIQSAAVPALIAAKLPLPKLRIAVERVNQRCAAVVADPTANSHQRRAALRELAVWVAAQDLAEDAERTREVATAEGVSVGLAAVLRLTARTRVHNRRRAQAWAKPTEDRNLYDNLIARTDAARQADRLAQLRPVLAAAGGPSLHGGRHRRAPGARPVRRSGSRRGAATRAGPDDADPHPPGSLGAPPARRERAGAVA